MYFFVLMWFIFTEWNFQPVRRANQDDTKKRRHQLWQNQKYVTTTIISVVSRFECIHNTHATILTISNDVQCARCNGEIPKNYNKTAKQNKVENELKRKTSTETRQRRLKIKLIVDCLRSLEICVLWFGHTQCVVFAGCLSHCCW